MRGKLSISVVAVILLFTSFTAHVAAQNTKRTFVRVAPGAGPAMLYEPASPSQKSEIAILISHPRLDLLEDIKCVQMASRGYRALCLNTVFDGMNSLDWDKALLQVRDGVRYLKKLAGVRKVILLGHSGGGPLFASYQNIAENGLSACQGPEKIIKCPDSFAGMPAGDGLILLDPILGYGAYTAITIDPAVVDETKGVARDWRLDPYDARNGFNPKGSTYGEDFVRRFSAAQKKRNDRLIEKALARLKIINARKGRYVDDEPFIVPGGLFAPTPQLWYMDIHLWSHTQDAYPLLRADGTAVSQIVRTVRTPRGGPASPSLSYSNAALATSVRRFLSTFACRTTSGGASYGEDFIAGIDYASSYSNTPSNLEGVSVPFLDVGMGAGTLLVSNEVAYKHARNADKTLAYVEGALHGQTPCKECEKYPGQFGDTVKTTFDYVDAWIGKPGRFGKADVRAEP